MTPYEVLKYKNTVCSVLFSTNSHLTQTVAIIYFYDHMIFIHQNLVEIIKGALVSVHTLSGT